MDTRKAPIQVKQEPLSEHVAESRQRPEPLAMTDDSGSGSGSSSSSDSESDDNDIARKDRKRRRMEEVLPAGFLDPLPSKDSSLPLAVQATSRSQLKSPESGCKQFWKAGDYERTPSCCDRDSSSGGMDHVRVHPKFLHSNATSHKWVLGAFAELLDNSLDEVCHGATYVNVDMILNKKDGNRMLLIEDDGGGMDPDKMRQCMSLGYSIKSKVANTIGQYGNGFKTSTMRLGADVIVFSRCSGNDGSRPTESIGLLSYTFLRSTGKEDIVVPMIDYEKRGQVWSKIIRASVSDWYKTVDTIVQWSPFSSEEELLQQFNKMNDHGTRIIIYNLWEDDEGLLELDFDEDPHDIQIRGVNRDEKNIQMAKQYPNSRHFLTYRHSLRTYASILYLRLPPGFRMILRGKDIEHHNIVTDMMMSEEETYRPKPTADGVPKDANMVANITIGFVKDAKAHIDVQGFNVYHKNRLIKPFWRLWHAPGSDGRGVIGALEANFVEPAHDKQGFERTVVLSRLEAKLVQMQKTYWSTNCHKIGYAARRNKKAFINLDSSPEEMTSISGSRRRTRASSGKLPASVQRQAAKVNTRGKVGERSQGGHQNRNKRNKSSLQRGVPLDVLSSSEEDGSDDDDVQDTVTNKKTNCHNQKSPFTKKLFAQNGSQTMDPPPGFRHMEVEEIGSSERRSLRSTTARSKGNDAKELTQESNSSTLNQLREENRIQRERLKRKEAEILGDLLSELQQERDKSKSLETQLEEAKHKIESLNREQENLLDVFAEERQRRDMEEEIMKKKFKEAITTIEELQNKVKLLEKSAPGGEMVGGKERKNVLPNILNESGDARGGFVQSNVVGMEPNPTDMNSTPCVKQQYEDDDEKVTTIYRNEKDWLLVEPAPGGPQIPSLLYAYKAHVARKIWTGEERRVLRCHGRNLNDIASKDPEVDEMLRAARYDHLREGTWGHQYDAGLLSAFVERWYPETNSFHFSFGEMTITLHDVQYLLGILVEGRPMRWTADMEVRYPAQILDTFGPDSQISLKSGVCWQTMLKLLQRGRRSLDKTKRYRGYLMMLLSEALFTGKLGSIITGKVIAFLDGGGEISWGSGCLAYLYRQLGIASRSDCNQFSGCLTLLQAWIYMYFPQYRPHQHISRDFVAFSQRFPIRPVIRDTTSRLVKVRDELERLYPEQVEWLPFHADPGSEVPISLYTGLIHYIEVAEPYMPGRVLRQFGYVQNIPRSFPYRCMEECRWKPHSYTVKYDVESTYFDWDTWRNHTISLTTQLGYRKVAYPHECTANYMEWFTPRTHMYVNPRDGPLAPPPPPRPWELPDYARLRYVARKMHFFHPDRAPEECRRMEHYSRLVDVCRALEDLMI